MKNTPASKQYTFYVAMSGVGLICLLILPDNLSTALLLFSVSVILLIIGNIPIRKILKVVLPLIGVAILGYFVAPAFGTSEEENRQGTEQYDDSRNFLERLPTWRKRIDRFVANIVHEKSPEEYMGIDKNLQPGFARIAIARGGFSPKLPGNSFARNFLPEANSDFIYAIIIEELGIFGGLFIIILYIALLFRCGRLVKKCKKKFPAFLLIGCSLIIFLQAMIHILVCVQLMPVTGQPLPLVSKGGTSLWITCVYFGIMLSVSRTIIPSEIERNKNLANISESEKNEQL
jgi:cell division protein FtsW